MSMTSSISMRRIGVVIAATVLLAACNDGDVTAPQVVQEPGPICDPIDLAATSEDGARTCVWSIDRQGNAGAVIPGLQCEGETGDCPGTFFCAAATSRWTAQSQSCPNDVAGVVPDPVGVAANIYVTTNNGLPNEVQLLERAQPVAGAQNPSYVLNADFIHNSRENQGAAVDASGNLLHVGDGLEQGVDATGQPDDSAAPGLITSCEVAIRGMDGDGNTYDGELDHELRGEFVAGLPPEFVDNPGLAAPKGMIIAPGLGLALVADFGNSTVRAFGLAAAGNQEPAVTISAPAPPWDLAYDEAQDILYVALTNGTIARYNDAGDALQAGNAPPLNALLRVSNAMGTQISSNLHGIVYEPTTDSLVLSDVGPATTMMDAASFNSDGAIYVLRNITDNPSSNIVPDRIIRGGSTMLGNPVDIVLSGRDLVVAEKANGRVLFFNDLYSGVEEDVTPSAAIEVAAPESLAFQLEFGASRPSVTDITTNSGVAVANLFVSRSVEGEITLERYDLAGNSETTYVIAEAGTFSQNVIAGLNGEALVTTSNEGDMITGPDSGILTINAFATRDAEGFDAEQDRRHSGGDLENPRGIDIAPDLGLLFVADIDTGTIKVLSACGDGTQLDELNVAAVSHDDMGDPPTPDPDAAPWDIDFDPTTGDLYVAMVNGNVAVFRSVVNTLQDGNAGNNNYSFTVDLQQIVDGVPQAVGVNLHGVEHVPGANGGSLILSDVGDAGVADDGAIYVLNNVATLGSTTLVNIEISGGNTLLGNPVDIAFDGANVYVAEKANGGGRILRFDGVLSGAGGNIAPDGMFSAPGAESISLVPDYIVNP